MRRKEDLSVSSKPIIVAGFFLGLHVLFAYWQPVSVWGADFLRFHDVGLRVVFVLLSVALLFLAARQRLGLWTSGLAGLRDRGVSFWRSANFMGSAYPWRPRGLLGHAFGCASARRRDHADA